MDNKWPSIATAVIIAAMFIAIGFSDMSDKSPELQKYEACIKFHSVKDCEDVK